MRANGRGSRLSLNLRKRALSLLPGTAQRHRIEKAFSWEVARHVGINILGVDPSVGLIPGIVLYYGGDMGPLIVPGVNSDEISYVQLGFHLEGQSWTHAQVEEAVRRRAYARATRHTI